MTVIANRSGVRSPDVMHAHREASTCGRCGADVVLFRDPAGEQVICTGCLEALRPRSTWSRHSATGTFWLEAALEHDARSDGTVLLCHGLTLAAYRSDGTGGLDLVEVLPTTAD